MKLYRCLISTLIDMLLKAIHVRTSPAV